MELIYSKDITLYSGDEYDTFLSENKHLSYNELLELAKQRNMECAFVFFKHFEEVENNYNLKFNNLQRGTNRKVTVHKILNEVNNELKEDLAQYMHEYIKHKNGYIDSWPIPYKYGLFNTGIDSVDDPKRINYTFNYFNGPIDDEGYATSEWVYQNHYRTPYSKKYSEYITKLNEAQKIVKSEKENNKGKFIDKIKAFIIKTPIVIGFITAVLMIYWTYTDTTSIANISLMHNLISMFTSDNILLKVISFIPMIITGLSALIWYFFAFIGWCFKIEKILIPIASFTVFGIFFGLSDIIENKIGYTNTNDSITFKNAKKTIKKINNNSEYKKLKREHESYNNDQRAISEIWHKEWFKILKETMDG